MIYLLYHCISISAKRPTFAVHYADNMTATMGQSKSRLVSIKRGETGRRLANQSQGWDAKLWVLQKTARLPKLIGSLNFFCLIFKHFYKDFMGYYPNGGG